MRSLVLRRRPQDLQPTLKTSAKITGPSRSPKGTTHVGYKILDVRFLDPWLARRAVEPLANRRHTRNPGTAGHL